MELKKHRNFRKIGVVLYICMFLVYLVVGLLPAEAAQYEIDTTLSIPAIDLESDVTKLTLDDHRLNTPDTIVGSFSRAKNKTLLIGHSSTVFGDLKNVQVGDEIIYGDFHYIISDIVVMEKTEILMDELLREANVDTLLIMTCAGEVYDNGDASHRLIVTAVADIAVASD